MKVQITQESKKWLTVAEMPAARKIIMEMKGNEYKTEELAKEAMDWIIAPHSYDTRILESSASIARNSRVPNDYYGEGTGKLDVWIEFIAFNTYDGAYWCGVYLSDIWSVSANNRDEIFTHCFVKRYVRQES